MKRKHRRKLVKSMFILLVTSMIIFSTIQLYSFYKGIIQPNTQVPKAPIAAMGILNPYMEKHFSGVFDNKWASSIPQSIIPVNIPNKEDDSKYPIREQTTPPVSKETTNNETYEPDNIIDEAKNDSEVNNHSDILKNIPEDAKIAYLTFDDGPSLNVTPYILNILKEREIKATFFVIGKQAEYYPELIHRMIDEGHVVANHTYTHNYKKIYANVQNFLDDLAQGEETLKTIIGEHYDSKLIRFPGGSFGSKKAKFRDAVVEHGYHYVDWNVLNGDAEAGRVSVDYQLKRLKETIQGKKNATILMHDISTKSTTVDALPAMIDYIESQGFIFDTLK